jgi:hypothetical protein
MKKTTLVFFLVAICSCTFAQHIMEVIPGERDVTVQTLLYNNNVHVPEPNSLHVYDGNVMMEIDYPTVDGIRLRTPFRGNIFVFGDAVHLVLDHSPSRRFIARYSSGAFTLTPITGFLNSDVVVFRGKMYMVVEVPRDVPKLISFDGTRFRDVTTLPYSPFYKLIATDENVYINGYFAEGPYYLACYNGTSFTNIPFGGAMEQIDRVIEDNDSDDCYLISDNVVLYFDGTAASSQLFYSEDPTAHVMGAALFRDEFYFQVSNHPVTELYRFSGATLTTVSPPAGTEFLRPYQSDLVIYRDGMYVPISNGGIPSVFHYDGTDWEPFFGTGIVSDRLQIHARAGKLVMYQANLSQFAYEYNGRSFEAFATPAGVDHFAEYKLTTDCYHLWVGSRFDTASASWHFMLMKETFDSLCVAPGSSSVIPGDIAEYDRIIIGNHARERDWCWTGIDIDWVLPICITPPCPTPQVQTRLTDKYGKTAWEKIFDKPFSASIPLNDSEPYQLSIDIEKDKKFGNVLMLDKDLVSNGVEDLSLDFYPKDGYFFLDVETDKKQQVPLTMTLRNTNGEALWEKKFTAPFHDVIYDRVEKAGDYLQVSLQTQGKSGVSYYPNPFSAKLNFTIAKGSDPVNVSVMNMNGKMVLQEEFGDGGDYAIEMNGQKAGLYILIIKEGANTRRELIEFKD